MRSDCLIVTTNFKKHSLSHSIQSLLTILLQILSLILGVVLYCVARKKAVMTGIWETLNPNPLPSTYFFLPPLAYTSFLSVPLLCILRIMLSIRDERDEKHNSFILKELTMIAKSQLIK